MVIGKKGKKKMIINIEQTKILEAFTKEAYMRDELHHALLTRGTIKKIDLNNDILVELDNDIYWVTTEPLIHLSNKNSDYEIKFRFEIRKGSKYNKVLYTFERS